jgi:hypothetical protein
MSPATPANGGDSTPVAHPILIVCPHCGKDIPPIVGPVLRYRALERKLSSAAFPFPFPTPIPGDRRLAETERIVKPDPDDDYSV